MSSESALELRVGRLENDSAALYELLDRFHSEFDDFRTETRSEFAKVNGVLGEFRSEFAKVNGVLGEFRSEFGNVNGILGEFRSEFAKVHGTLEQILRRLPAASN